MKNYFLLTALLALFILPACDEDQSIDPTLMPPVTQTGARTFGCLIDGWVYVGGRYAQPTATYYPASEEGAEASVVIKAQVSRNETISFRILNPKEKGEITIYSLHTTSKQSSPDVCYTQARFGEIPLEDGTVEVLRFNLPERIISGTFCGGRMTEGRFDLRISTDE